MTFFSLPLIGASQAVSLGSTQLLPFSGNTVNVYTGTEHEGTDTSLEPHWKPYPWVFWG